MTTISSFVFERTWCSSGKFALTASALRAIEEADADMLAEPVASSATRPTNAGLTRESKIP